MSKELTSKDRGSALRRMVDEISTKLNRVKTSTDEDSGTATISGEMGGKQWAFIVRERDLGQAIEASEYKKLPRKSDYRDEVHYLYRAGYKQREIAAKLGISQSLVSKLLHS